MGMRLFKLIITSVFFLLYLSGCLIIFLPLPSDDAFVDAIKGPRFCVPLYTKIGDRNRLPNGKWVTVTEIFGESDKCKDPYKCLLIRAKYDEGDEPVYDHSGAGNFKQ